MANGNYLLINLTVISQDNMFTSLNGRIMEWTTVGMDQGPIPEFILREWVKTWKSSGTAEPRIKLGTCQTLTRSSN
jgi:hypothetical protein